MHWSELRAEDFVPDVNALVIENGKPVDGILSEKQMRLLTRSLHSGGWDGPPDGQPFVVMANVGLFHATGEPPLVPDALLAAGVRQGDVSVRENLAYFMWLRRKPPDVVVEIVSNREGNEDGSKLQDYARIGVSYYVIFDPLDQLRGGIIRVYQRQGGTYQPLPRPWFFAEVGLGVDLWEGRFEDVETTWLRWYDRDGQVIPTGAERAEAECQRAEAERQHAEAERQRAEQAEQRAAAEKQEAERARRELEALKDKLKAAGISLPP
jgi:hypothetical protein